jgi:cytochrome b561
MPAGRSFLFADQARYTSVAIALHWIIAAVIVFTFGLGLYMANLPASPTKLRLYSYHKWIGVTIFVLVVFRLLWRLTHRVPPPPPYMPGWQRVAAAASHVSLYVLTLAIPLSGWLFSSASGFQVVYLGKFPLPDLVEKNKMLAEQLQFTHHLLNYLMAAVVLLHVAAALKHHWIDRDDVLKRMLPSLGTRSQSQ